MENKERVMLKLKERICCDGIGDDGICQASKGTLLLSICEFSVAMDDLRFELKKAFKSDIDKIMEFVEKVKSFISR